MALSWFGEWARKRDVLAQIDTHRERGSFAPLHVDGKDVWLYGWSQPADLDGLRAILGIPVGLLALGLALYDDFPETPEGIVRVIEARRELLDAVPIGHELSWVVDELAAWRLVDDTVGLITTIGDAKLEGLLATTAEALRAGLPEMLPRAELRADRDAWLAEKRRQWQADRKVEPAVEANLRAAEAALHACDVADDPRQAARLVTAGSHDAMAAALGRILAELA